ncbi:hypothetical protein [Candidatus Mycoplasma haematobovis]|nr:hypothetical protein [Candidatus Mycoplasma haematobovis]
MSSALALGIDAYKYEISKFVLMPRDPLRAKWAVDKFLKNAKEFFLLEE